MIKCHFLVKEKTCICIIMLNIFHTVGSYTRKYTLLYKILGWKDFLNVFKHTYVHRPHLSDQKYSENSNVVKYYNVK